MITMLRTKNDEFMAEFIAKGDKPNIMKHKIIGELLKYDDCFMRLSFDKGYTILKSLKIKNWKTVYAKLLSA